MSSPRSLHDSAFDLERQLTVLGVSRVQPAFHSIAVQQELRGRTFYDRVVLRMQRQGRRARDLKAVRQIGRVRFPDLHGRGVVVKAKLRVALQTFPRRVRQAVRRVSRNKDDRLERLLFAAPGQQEQQRQQGCKYQKFTGFHAYFSFPSVPSGYLAMCLSVNPEYHILFFCQYFCRKYPVNFNNMQNMQEGMW